MMADENEENDKQFDEVGDRKSNDLDEDFLTLGDVDDESDEDEAKGETEEENQNVNRTGDLPPWMTQYVDYRRTNHLVALHNEIVGFCRLMEPHDEETKERKQLVDRFSDLVMSTFDRCKVQVFGSQATGLCLPTSDIDISIQLSDEDTPKAEGGDGTEKDEKERLEITKEQEINDMKNWDKPSGSPLHRLAEALRENWMSELSYLDVIENTRVPLVKFTHGPTNISVDVCFNQQTGPQAAKLMHQYMDALPPLRSLTFVLKYFMASRGLNQPYTGGVGSFMLQMMIVSFLQHRERFAYNTRSPSLYNLGALLVEFLELYSMDFNYVTTGLSVRFDGFYFPKGASDRKNDFWQPQRPFSLAMENPLEISADVGNPSFRISVVQRSFEVAFKVLLSHVTVPVIPAVSILASILPPTEEMRKRAGAKTRSKPIEERPRKRQRH